MEIFKWVIWDKEDNLSIDYELFAWSEVELPKKYVLNNDRTQHQGITEETAYMCTAFANTEWANEILYKRWNNKSHKWITLGRYMVEKWLLDIKSGAYIIDAVKCAKDIWIINGYTTIKTIQQIKESIYKDRPIVVWSNQINRKETQISPFIATRKSSYWHAFVIVWYDDERWVLICENSYGNMFDKWRFYIKYDDFDILYFSKFSIFINDDNFTKLNYLKEELKRFWYKDFYDLYIKWKTWTDRMLWELAYQLVILKKVNNKELLKLLK